VALGACGGLHGDGLPLGYAGRWWCEPTAARGAVELDAQGHVHATRLGRGELSCREHPSLPVEVRQAAKIEIVLLAPPSVNDGLYVYTRVYDADGNNLWKQSDQFVWSATNGTIEPGTCGGFANCTHDGSSATLHSNPGIVTIDVSYLGAHATRSEPVAE
jgi:hypothetical protein